MRALITGGGGLVATALARRIPAAVTLTHAQLDITNRPAIFAAVRELRPDLIINCAVVGVDACEADPRLAEAINVDGPALLAEAAGALVHFSSNYVLDPVNVYGRTKLRGEAAVAERCPRALIIRTSWVFGPGKESFVGSVHRRLLRGEKVLAAADVFASTTYVEHLTGRLMELLHEQRYGIVNVANAGVCSYLMIAREAARIAAADRSLIVPVREDDLGRAPRPRYTPLVTEPPLPDWRAALVQYIQSAP